MDNLNYTLCLVTDSKLMHTDSLEELVLAAIQGGVTLVQLREKQLSSADFLTTARKVKQITDQYEIPLIINDNYQVAYQLRTAGVHVGQQDTSIRDIKKILYPEQIVGVSVANQKQAQIASAAGADYLGAGPVFPTNTKYIKDGYVSLPELTRICESVSIPVVAIGGINKQNIALLKSTGIAGVAVISAIVGQVEPQAAAKQLRNLLDLWKQ